MNDEANSLKAKSQLGTEGSERYHGITETIERPRRQLTVDPQVAKCKDRV